MKRPFDSIWKIHLINEPQTSPNLIFKASPRLIRSTNVIPALVFSPTIPFPPVSPSHWREFLMTKSIFNFVGKANTGISILQTPSSTSTQSRNPSHHFVETKPQNENTGAYVPWTTYDVCVRGMVTHRILGAIMNIQILSHEHFTQFSRWHIWELQ